MKKTEKQKTVEEKAKRKTPATCLTRDAADWLDQVELVDLQRDLGIK